MGTIDGLTIEERGGPERCDGGTCYAGCTCSESAWAEKLAASEERARRLEEDVAFLAPRAHKDGEWYADENRDFGLSANNLVNVAYGAKDAGNRPYDIWDMRACERAYAKLPAHRMTEEVRLLLVACRAALTPPPEAAPAYRQMTPEEDAAQRRSFAYGNAKLANDDVTREMLNPPPEAEKRGEG